MDRKPYEASCYAVVSIVFFYISLIYKFPPQYIGTKKPQPVLSSGWLTMLILTGERRN